ncbi:hypothetical protein JTB14_026212 [Gonioctena quinquepunctata]|nr:hypothetical protein JTB14_026212 [Gonioctena quinquepunctata]
MEHFQKKKAPDQSPTTNIGNQKEDQEQWIIPKRKNALDHRPYQRCGRNQRRSTSRSSCCPKKGSSLPLWLPSLLKTRENYRLSQQKSFCRHYMRENENQEGETKKRIQVRSTRDTGGRADDSKCLDERGNHQPFLQPTAPSALSWTSGKKTAPQSSYSLIHSNLQSIGTSINALNAIAADHKAASHSVSLNTGKHLSNCKLTIL